MYEFSVSVYFVHVCRAMARARRETGATRRRTPPGLKPIRP